jgi:hypothetical protein
MRAILTACAALAALCLTSCDSNTGTPKAAKVECNCAPPAQTAGVPDLRGNEAAPRPHQRHYGHARYTYPGHAWRREYSEISVETYDYHSDSRSFAMADGGAYAGGSGEGYRAVEHGWIDGYGRSHGGGATAGASVDYDGRTRRDTWHGYDAECPDKDRK